MKNYQNMLIVGSQWGDEGKGKITDTLAENFDIVVRYQGGNNAGHTIYVKNKKRVLHLLPSGVLHEHCMSILGQGMVVDLSSLKEEIRQLDDITLTNKNLKISNQAWVVTPYHQILDALREANSQIGTTKKGIGPCYEDRATRRGLKIRDLFDYSSLVKKLDLQAKEKFCLFHHLPEYKKIVEETKISIPSVEECAKNLHSLAEYFSSFIDDTSKYLWDNLDKKRMLFEGAQGILLDPDVGTYPYVTSSNTIAQGVMSGCTIPIEKMDCILGISKCYTTRVGNGPFPSELPTAQASILQKLGNEVGATTGRVRRCGVLDLPLLRYAARISSLTHLALTKFDVFQEFSHHQICTQYRWKNEVYDQYWPFMDWEKIEPIYEEIPAQTLQSMENFQHYIEEQVKIPVPIITFGPNRDQIFYNR